MDLTQILDSANAGDSVARNQLIQVAYDEQLTYQGNWVPDIERQLERIRGLAKDFN